MPEINSIDLMLVVGVNKITLIASAFACLSLPENVPGTPGVSVAVSLAGWGVSRALVQVPAAPDGAAAVWPHLQRQVVRAVAGKATQRCVRKGAVTVPATISVTHRKRHKMSVLALAGLGRAGREVGDGWRRGTRWARTDVGLHDAAQTIVPEQQARVTAFTKRRTPRVLDDPVRHGLDRYRGAAEGDTGRHLVGGECTR